MSRKPRQVDSDNLNNIFDLEDERVSYGAEDVTIDEGVVVLDNGVVESPRAMNEVSVLDEEEGDLTSLNTIDGMMKTNSTDTDESLKQSDVDFVNDNIKDMITDIKDIIGACKYMIDSSPDAESIQSAGQLFTSATMLIRELNKEVLLKRKQNFEMKIATFKAKAKKELALAKSKSGLPEIIGSGNTINIQNNNNQSVQFSQEQVVRDMLKLTKK